jgi:cell wall-associated NlpC family hydrolase
VASHRAPKKTARAAFTITAATAATAAGVAIVPTAASAESVSQAKAEINQLNQQAESATNAYDAANEQVAQMNAQLTQLQAKIAAEQEHINSLEASLGTLAAAQYRGSGMDQTLQLMLSQHPDQFLQQSTTLDELTSQETASLKQLQQAERQMKQDKLQAAQELVTLDATQKKAASDKATIQSKLGQQQTILNGLTASERTAVEGGSPTMSVNTGSVPAASARAASALSFAESRLGDEYVYGAEGPVTFDCSGLVEWSFAQAGISLPRTSQEQAGATTSIPESDLAPGDLVFFYGYDHVGIYAGNGWIIHAPHTGTVVQYTKLSDMQAYYDSSARVS